MMSQTSDTVSEAVLFFDGPCVVKEMLYAEFEAVLDNVVGIQEFAGRECQAVFVKVNRQLFVKAAVFFSIRFESDGLVERNWNMPLMHMSEISGRGPDLGAGAIRLACRSQCPIAWHQRSLWDPVMGAEGNSFVAIKNALQNNKLCLITEEHAPPTPTPTPTPTPPAAQSTTETAMAEPPVLQPLFNGASNAPQLTMQLPQAELLAGGSVQPIQAQNNADSLPQNGESENLSVSIERFSQSERNKAAKLIKRLRFQLTTMQTAHKDSMDKLKSEQASEFEQWQQKLSSMQKTQEVEKKRNIALKENLAEQGEEYQLAREQFLDQIDEAKALEKSQLDSLKKKYGMELKAKLEAESSQLKEMLDMREVELYYRDEQIANLREDIAELRNDKQKLLHEGGDRFLDKLSQCGITFVAYHPGAGHLTIPIADAGRYLESPIAYVAEKCFVTEERYLNWLDHYQHPCCTGMRNDKECCAVELPRANSPGHFIPGKSDRCQEHALSAANIDDQMLKIS